MPYYACHWIGVGFFCVYNGVHNLSGYKDVNEGIREFMALNDP